MLDTIEAQRAALNTPVEARFIRTSSAVKGPYTTGQYVIWKLNQIFGPDHWSHTVLSGPEIITLNEKNAYARAVIRLTVRFANGEEVVHEDVGVWPLSGSRNRATGDRQSLGDEAPERYETSEKAAITDGIKACCEYLGICFRPSADDFLEAAAQPTIRPTAPARRNAAEPASERPPAASKAEPAKTATATEFWARLHKLEKDRKMTFDRSAAEIMQAQKTGDWQAALAWLDRLAASD